MTPLARPLILLAMACAGLGACAQRSLHPTYGGLYRGAFSAQLAERSIRPLAPLSGDEAKRIISSYYEGLGGGGAASAAPSAPSGGGGGSASFSIKGR